MANNRESYVPPIIDVDKEKSFRAQAIMRLTQDHRDLPTERFNRWIELLEDSDPNAHVLAATAVWEMMDVRDAQLRHTDANS